MKAFVVDRFGSKHSMRLADLAEPEVGEDEVLIEIHAAGVNPMDIRIRDGAVKQILPYRPPFVLGSDLAGVVVQVGPRVHRFKPGDEVIASTRQGRMGTFSEVTAVPEADVAMKPNTLGMEEAASIPLAGLTAWQALVERAGLQRDQKVLIHAGSGGVGTMAIQLAKHLGATVATTTSTKNLAFVKSLGADIAIDHKTDDFETILHDFDVVLDTVGGKTLEKSLRVLKPGGQAIGLAGPPDPQFAKQIGAAWPMRRAIGLTSHRIRSHARRRNVNYSFLLTTASGEQLAEVTSLIDTGIIRPVVDRLYPFRSTEKALAYVGTGRGRGQVVIYIVEDG